MCPVFRVHITIGNPFSYALLYAPLFFIKYFSAHHQYFFSFFILFYTSILFLCSLYDKNFYAII